MQIVVQSSLREFSLSAEVKRRLVIAALLLVLGIFLWAMFPRAGNPVVKGKTVRAWILLASDRNPEAIAVLKEQGTNARPEFIRGLTRQDSTIRKLLWNARKKLDPRLRKTTKLDPPLAWDERARTARALGSLGPDSAWALPYLAEAIHDRFDGVSQSAAAAMGQIGKASVPYLVRSLTEDPSHRRSVLNALGQIGPDAEAAVPAITECLNDADDFVRSRADYALRAIGAPWVKRLTETVLQGTSDARIAAAKELLLIYPPSMQTAKALIAMLDDPSPAARRQAAEAIGVVRPYHSETVPALVRRLSDESADVREAAATALGRLGARATPAITNLSTALADHDERVRKAADTAIVRIENAPVSTK